MSIERILNMLLRQVMRQFVHRGIGAGMDAMRRRKSRRAQTWQQQDRAGDDGFDAQHDRLDDGLTPEDREELARLKAKQSARRRRRARR